MAWTSPRTWVAGEIVTAALLNTHVRDNLNDLADGAWGRDTTFVVKPSNESVIASTTMQDDAHLQLPVSASAKYIVSVCLFGQANNTNDGKFGWSLPSGTFNMLKNAPSTAIAAGTTNAEGNWAGLVAATTSTSNAGLTDASITMGFEFKALLEIGGTGGTATLQWAQLVSGSTLTVLAGSWLYAHRVA